MSSNGQRRSGRAVGYVRRSTDRQEQSIGDQKKAIEAYAAEHGLRLIRFYVDDAISGTSAVGRRAFQQMIADAQKPSGAGFDLVVVYDVKRFGRLGNDEAGYYRHLLRTRGVEVRYVSESFTGDATDDLLRPVKQWQARQESSDLSKVTIRGLLSKFDDSTGWWMGGVPPYGYDLRYESADGRFLLTLRYTPDGSKQVLDERGELVRTLARGESLNISKRDRARLVPSDPQRVAVVRRIFKMYAELGKGYKAVAQTLNAEGVATPRGPQWARIYSGKWTDTTIRAILVNPLYAGDMVWNRRTDARFHRIGDGRAVQREAVHGHRLVPNDASDWIVVRDAHEPLVGRRLFEMATQRREDHPSSIEQRGSNPRLKTQGRTWQGRRSRFILSGLMTCARCGNRYQGLTRTKGKSRADGTPVRAFAYGCGGYITKGRAVCQLGGIPQEQLESAVIEAVLDQYSAYHGKNGRRKLAEAVRQQMGDESGEVAEARGRVEAERERLTGIINNLLDNLTTTNRQFVDQRLKELTQQRERLEERAEELERLATSQGEIEAVVTDAWCLLSGLELTLREGLPQEKLAALRQCVQRVNVDGKAEKAELRLYAVPGAGLEAVERLELNLAARR